MNSGDYDRLNVSVKDLNSTIMKLSVGSNKSTSREASDHTVDEDGVVQQFGHVTNLRDTYVTSSCLLLLVCVSFTIIGQPRNSVLIRRV